MRTAPVDGVRSTLRNFRLGGLAERAKATPVLRTYDGDTKYQLGNLHSRQKQFLAIFFRIFQLRTWKITVNTLTSIIFHRSFLNLTRTFITLRSRTSSIMEVLPH